MRALREENGLIPINLPTSSFGTFQANQVLLANANLAFDLDSIGQVVLHVRFKTSEIAATVRLDQESTIHQKSPSYRGSRVDHPIYKQLLDIRSILNREMGLMKTRTNYQAWAEQYGRMIATMGTVSHETRSEYAELRLHIRRQTEINQGLRLHPENIIYKQEKEDVDRSVQKTLQNLTNLFIKNTKSFPRIATELWAFQMLIEKLLAECYDDIGLRNDNLFNMDILIHSVKSSLRGFFEQVSLPTATSLL